MVANQLGPREDELTKNLWIPFASTAVVFALMAVLVWILSNVGTHAPTATSTPVATQATVSAPPLATIYPTLTDLPSPTLTPTPKPPLTLRVLPVSVNVRMAPSTSAKVVGQVKKDNLVTPMARSDDGRWFLVVNAENGMTGWVASEFFETISGDLKVLPTVVSGSPQ